MNSKIYQFHLPFSIEFIALKNVLHIIFSGVTLGA